MRPCSPPAETTFRPLPKPAFPKDPRVLARWERRLSLLADERGYLLQATLTFVNTRPFYDPTARAALKTFLARFLHVFVVKFEVAWQASGFLLPHAHLLLPISSQALPFLKALREKGAKPKRPRYRRKLLPPPFALLRGKVLELPDLSPLEPLIDFRSSTIATLAMSRDLARYLAKQTYAGMLSPVLVHNLR